jgi:osmotically-inducible protein OsmY
MRRYGKWVLTLGILAATPGISSGALPWWPFGKSADSAAAANQNQKTAEEIAAALRQARLSGSDIEIEFKNGVATLGGKIYDPAQKLQATRVVERVPGVRRVDNRLALTRAPQTDAVSQTESKSPFDRLTPKTPALDASAFKKPEAKRSLGIRQVSFENSLESTGGTSNQQMAEQIAGALSEAQFNGYDIQIQYQDGTATLMGAVTEPSQRARATQIVSQIPGVQTVDNQLQVMGGGQIPAYPAAYQPNGVQPMPPGIPPMAPPPVDPGVPGVPAPPVYAAPGPGYNPSIYNQPHLPEHAWPAYAQYPNSAAVTYPTQYSASAWPYIGPFYPYPQVPLGWREAQLEWDDGYWALNFRPRTNRWWWFMHPENW